MAVTIANSTDFNTAGYNATHTISAFACNGTDSHLLVASFNKNPTVEVSSITANAVAMTLERNSENASTVAAQIYGYKINNASFDVVANTPGYKQEAMVAIALAGANQTDAVIGETGATGYGTAATVAYTGTSGNLLVVAVTNADSAQPLTASNCTQLSNFDHTTDVHECFVGYVTATGSSQTIGATMAGSANYAVAIVEIATASAATPPFIRAALIL